MKNYKTTFALGGLLFLGAISLSQADPCLEVTMTGTMGGPGTFNGLAGFRYPGALWRRDQRM